MKKQGFTIIELLIAVALTVIIGMLVSMAFTNTQQASQRVTTAMRLQQKGRAIMDLISRDLANMAYDSNISASAPDPALASGAVSTDLYFKTRLPIQRSHYSNTTDAAHGYYAHDTVRVKWDFANSVDLNGNGNTNDHGEHKVLFRLISSPSIAVSVESVMSNATVFTDAETRIADNVVTSEDMRGFEISPVYNSGGKINGYSVSFSLTDAPYDATENSSFDGNHDIDTMIDAEEEGYVWLYFKRTVSSPAQN